MEMMEMLKSMQAEIKTLKTNQNSTNIPNSGGTYQGNREYAKDKYCWSHGKNGSHTSGQCSRKREGHKPEATLTNRMGCSNRFCGDNKWRDGLDDAVHVTNSTSKLFYTSSDHPPNLKYIVTKGDSAASGHYWRQHDLDCLKNVRFKLGPNVKLPDNSTIQANQQGNLPLHASLTSKASSTVILPSLKSASLISLG